MAWLFWGQQKLYSEIEWFLIMYPESGFCTYLILNIFQLHNGDTNKSILSSEAETVIFHSNMQLIHRETIFISNHAKNSEKVLKKSLKSEE